MTRTHVISHKAIPVPTAQSVPVHWYLKAVLVLLFSLSVSGCNTIKNPFPKKDDQGFAIARNVKSELVSNPDIEAAPLRVRVQNKTIVLEGFVETVEESLEAEQTARKLYPRYGVLNFIEIR